MDQETAIQICCLMIRNFFKDSSYISLDKKSSFEYLEREVLAQSVVSPVDIAVGILLNALLVLDRSIQIPSTNLH